MVDNLSVLVSTYYIPADKVAISPYHRTNVMARPRKPIPKTQRQLSHRESNKLLRESKTEEMLEILNAADELVIYSC